MAAAPPLSPWPKLERDFERPRVPPAPVAVGYRGVVASAHPDASAAGIDALNRGGNAIDAAVATAFALSVVEPNSSGLGGGGFLLYYDAEAKKTTVVDFREVAPLKAHRDMYLVGGQVDPKRSRVGILGVGVPGAVPGLAAAQARLGKLRLKDVLPRAIRLAERGFLVGPELHGEMVRHLETLRSHPETARVFLKRGRPYLVGERFVQPDLAKTLKAIERRGPKVFTQGWVARAIAKESAKLGGVLALEDLKRYEPRFREPLIGEYKGHVIHTMPPPSSGGVHLLQMLRLLEIHNRRRAADRAGSAVERAHVLAEIMRRAYADRAVFLGDPAFVKVPIEELLSDDYLSERYAEIDLARASSSEEVKAGKPGGITAPEMIAAPKESPHTTHLTVIDAEGNAASLTNTINYTWGSGVVATGTGVLLNNEMDDFAVAPGVPNAYGLVGGEANAVAPGKIPLSSMTPTIVLREGRVRLALGSPGGSTIITTVLQTILNVVDEEQDIATAIAAPRMHMQWLPDRVAVEPDFPESIRAGLRTRGHKVVQIGPWGNATAVEVLADRMRVGAADPREDGGCDAQ